MNNKIIKSLVILSALGGAGLTHAHPGHGYGFLDGLSHPMLGVDHFLAMLAVGIWAARLGGRALWAVPAGFVTLMAGSAALAMCGIVMPHAESGIAASILVLGLLIAFAVDMRPAAGTALVAVFAVFHGTAHGLEMPAMAAPLYYGIGFIAATATLHALGIAVGFAGRAHALVLRSAGALLAAGGGVMLALR